MNKGTLAELPLSRSVTKHIKKQNKNLVQGTGVGHDFTCMKTDAGSVISTEGIHGNPEIAWAKAFNNFYVSGGTPLFVRVTMLLPEEIREGMIKDYMNSFNSLAVSEGVQLAGGDTYTSDAYTKSSFIVTVTGIGTAYQNRRKMIAPGDDIIMIGYAAMLGTDIIRKDKEEELLKRFSKSYIKGEFLYSIKAPATLMARQEDVYYMHDVSEGGIYTALWQLGQFVGRGISIGHFSIPICQETIEFCECFDINPYMLEGTGAMLAVVKKDSGAYIVEMLQGEGIQAALIGHIEENNERMVYLGDAHTVKMRKKDSPDEAAYYIDGHDNYIERRCLAPMKGDEIYKVIK